MTEPCPNANELTDLWNDRLDESTRERLESHLGECPFCQRQLLELAGDVRAIHAAEQTSAAPSASFLERLKEIARATAALPTVADEAKQPFIPGFEILGESGRGGTAVIYKAKQATLNRIVALKVIPIDRMSPDSLRRNRRGVEALAGLTHPGIVQIFEIGLHDRFAFGALEFMDGGNLKQRLHESPCTPEQAARWLKTIAEAVQFMHANGIVHRDLKTSNVLLTAADLPKIADFGLAKRWDEPDDVTRAGDIFGTPAYMAPEQATGGAVGVPADIYALGVILYDLLAGHPPFRGATTLDTLEQVIHLAPLPPSRLEPKTPRDLETICLKCLRKEPENRYATAQALADDLGRFLQGEPIVARPIATTERISKWLRRRPDLAILLAAMAVFAMSAIVLLLVERGQLHRAIADESRLRQDDAAKLADVEGQLFEARMTLARQAIAANDFAAARAILQAARPQAGDPGRNREWQSLWSQCEKQSP